MIKRVNNDQPYCGVNVKGSEGTCLALDFHGTMVIFVKRLIILFYRRLSDQVSTITHHGYFFFTYVGGSLLLLLNVYVYITHRLNSPAVENIEHSRYFWISIGILVFYIPFLPVFLGVKYALIHILVFRGILLLLQILMHTSFIVGIRWGNRI